MKSKKILVAYFSHTGKNYGVGYIDKGNTNIIADMIAEQTGSNSFEIRTVTPYPVEYALLAEAIQSLSEKKRKVVLLSYFMDMSDAEIARVMNLVRSTVHEHRRRSLELMKEIMEEYQNEQEK